MSNVLYTLAIFLGVTLPLSGNLAIAEPTCSSALSEVQKQMFRSEVEHQHRVYVRNLEQDQSYLASLQPLLDKWKSSASYDELFAEALLVVDDLSSGTVMRAVLKASLGAGLSESDRKLLVGLGIDPNHIDAYFDVLLATFQPYIESLRDNGFKIVPETGTWDFDSLTMNLAMFQDNPSFVTGMSLFFGPEVTAKLADADRLRAVALQNWVALPPDASGRIEIYARERYTQSVVQRLDILKNEAIAFMSAAEEAATYWNLMHGRLWEWMGYERGYQGKTAIEIERDSAGTRVIQIANALLYRFGIDQAARDHVLSIWKTMNDWESYQLQIGISKLDTATYAAIAAPFVPLLIYAAPLVASTITPALAPMAAQASATLAAFPLVFGLGSAGIHASIDHVAGGASLICALRERVVEYGEQGLIAAPFLASLPSIGTGLGGAVATFSTIPAGLATAGLFDLATAGYFVQDMARSGWKHLEACRATIALAERVAEAGADIELVDAIMVDAYHSCADAGVDLSFAATMGMQLTRGARHSFHAMKEWRATVQDGRNVLGRELTRAEQDAIFVAHWVGRNAKGADGDNTHVGNYTPEQLRQKARILREAGLNWAEIRVLMENGIVGEPVPAHKATQAANAEAAHEAITTDLFRGDIVEARPFNANNNQTDLYLVKVYNQRTGRTREALFKPRPFGDGDGWNRTPMEYVTYELNRMLGMDYVPPAAYRRHLHINGKYVAEGVLLYMVPDAHALAEVPVGNWNLGRKELLSDTRILDVLIQNSDRHKFNFLRGRHWTDGSYRAILIDHAAGLRPEASVNMGHENAFGTGAVQHVRRATLKALKQLTFEKLKHKVGEFVGEGEIHQLLSRRDGIVAYFEALVAERGAENVILD